MQDQRLRRNYNDYIDVPNNKLLAPEKYSSIADFFIVNLQMLYSDNACTQAEIDAFDEFLMTQDIARPIRVSIVKYINGESLTDEENKYVRWILGQSLAFVTEKSNNNFDVCISAVDKWHVHRGFYSGLKELIKTHNNSLIDLISDMMLEFASHPENCILKPARDRFL